MFTTGAFVLIALIGWYGGRTNEKDRPSYDAGTVENRVWLLLLHTRQDIKLVSFLLGGIIIMLGIVADRIH